MSVAEKRKLRVPHSRRTLFVSAVALVLAIGIMSIAFFILNPDGLKGKERGTVPVQTSAPSVTPDSLTKLLQAFGPWHLVSNTDVTNRGIVLLNANGTKEVGSKIIQPNRTWQPAAVPEFRDVIIGKEVAKLRTTQNVVYAINPGQAFVLAWRPETVYAFAMTGAIVSSPASNLD